MEVNSIPAVIDFDSLLRQISEEAPSGESLQYSGLYDEIREARRADDGLAQGDWQRDLKTADFKKVIDLALPALNSQTKDLQIAVWLAEALARENGFAGLRDGLRLSREFQNAFWDSLFPEIDEGDMEGRANALEWLDRQCAQCAKEIAITAGDGLTFVNFEESKQFDIPDNLEAIEYEKQQKYIALKQQADEENRITGDRWRRAKAQSRRAFYEELNLTLEECWNECLGLDSIIEEKFERNQAPSLTQLKKSLDAIRDAVKKILQEKREAEPTEEELNAGNEASEEAIAAEAGPGNSGAGAGISGPVKSRQEALKRLTEVADFFRKTEPHSPVSHLIQRAVKWGNMPLENLLQELVKDSGVLEQIRETLGFNTYGDQSPGDQYTEQSDSGETQSDW